jgi:hypothetical protein
MVTGIIYKSESKVQLQFHISLDLLFSILVHGNTSEDERMMFLTNDVMGDFKWDLN